MGVVVVAQVSGRGSVRVLLWVSAKVFNKGRLPRNCIHTACVSLRFLDAILRNDGVYSAGIKNNTRGVVAVYIGCCARFALRVDVISAWV